MKYFVVSLFVMVRIFFFTYFCLLHKDIEMLDHEGDSLAPHILEGDSPTQQIHGEVVLSTDTPSSSAVGKIFKLFSNDLMILL
jgi:hypothetical protein